MSEPFAVEMDRLVRDDRALRMAESRPQGWVRKALAEIDEALAQYATMRGEMNQDGLGDKRQAHVDQMLEQRLRFVRHLEHGEPLEGTPDA